MVLKEEIAPCAKMARFSCFYSDPICPETGLNEFREGRGRRSHLIPVSRGPGVSVTLVIGTTDFALPAVELETMTDKADALDDPDLKALWASWDPAQLGDE